MFNVASGLPFSLVRKYRNDTGWDENHCCYFVLPFVFFHCRQFIQFFFFSCFSIRSLGCRIRISTTWLCIFSCADAKFGFQYTTKKIERRCSFFLSFTSVEKRKPKTKKTFFGRFSPVVVCVRLASLVSLYRQSITLSLFLSFSVRACRKSARK